jgi:hypothetical protein
MKRLLITESQYEVLLLKENEQKMNHLVKLLDDAKTMVNRYYSKLTFSTIAE